MNDLGRFLDFDDAGDSDRPAVRVQDDRRSLEDLPGRAHPRAQDRGMGLGRVMRMVPGVGHRLWIGQPAQQQEADGQADGNGSEGASREHRARY